MTVASQLGEARRLFAMLAAKPAKASALLDDAFARGMRALLARRHDHLPAGHWRGGEARRKPALRLGVQYNARDGREARRGGDDEQQGIQLSQD